MNTLTLEKFQTLNHRYFETPSDTRTISDFIGLEEAVTDLCAAIIVEYFHEHGLDIQTISKYSISALSNKLGILDKYQRMYQLFLHILESKHIIEMHEQMVTYHTQAAKRFNTQICLHKIHDLYPQFSPFYSFLADCGKQYTPVLSGKKSSQSVLYPPGNINRLEYIYNNIPKIGYEKTCLKLVRDIIFNHGMEKNTSCSVLEAGAGQGILTQQLLPLMGKQISTYYYTDIASSLVQYGKMKFNAFSQNMQFLSLDIEKSSAEQHAPGELVDFVVAFNVVHATRNIGKTLVNLKQYLKQDGYLLLVENVKQEYWIDLIYGLTDEWWAYDDKYRIHSPLLTINQWEEVIKEAEFTHSYIFPKNNETRITSETALIVIKNNDN